MNPTDHPLSETAVAEMWDAHRDPGVVPFHAQGRLYVRGQTAMLRAAFDAGREHERAQADPHHDPRPWQDCTRDDIRKGDLVEVRDDDFLRIGVAYHRDEAVDWWTQGGWLLTDGDRWPLRRIPAPARPAEEVELPTEFGAVITDVEADLGETVRLDRMVWTGRRWAYEYHSATAEFITSCTLPDGTRIRRDGEREDGTPRFIKVEEGQ